MSTRKLREALDYLEHNPTADEAQAVRREARKELEAVERAATDVVRWNNEGQPRLHADAARGWSVLESIAREAE